MVLPCGMHVRFGPTEWAAAEGFDYPKTTQVSGACNARADEEDETAWEWRACDTEIAFDDLWHAVRGGGGGSYGVVTAASYQLHALWDLKFVFVNAEVSAACGVLLGGLPSDEQTAFENLWCVAPRALRLFVSPPAPREYSVNPQGGR